MQHFNLITRRGFLDRGMKIGLAAALGSLVDIPFVLKRALAEGNIGLNGKKLLFIFLRGANDGLNSVAPIGDPAYVDISGSQGSNPNWGRSTFRPNLALPPDPVTDYFAKPGTADFPQAGTASTFGFYPRAIRLGNGFAALHPSLKFLAPLYNAGDLAVIHRVAYPRQSRSHFDSQNYWENGTPNNNLVKDGILYRTMLEATNARINAVNAVSIQSALPLILRGSQLALTNLSNVNRYALLGIPNDASGMTKATNAVANANMFPFPAKQNRELLELHYENLIKTLPSFAEISANSTTSFTDNVATDGDTVNPYELFPRDNNTNGGYVRGGGVVDANKYVVDTGAYGFFNNLRAAALVLNKTEATIAGTEVGGFDTHQQQGTLTGGHPNLQRRIGWALYGLWKYFTKYPERVDWNNLVVVTLSEFGRTSAENADLGTDHAEAGVMLVAGGGVRGGVYGCSPSDSVPWVTGTTTTRSGSMFAIGNPGNYLKRSIDFRSVFGEIIREHLGATQNQLNRIIPGYTVPGESLLSGGTSSIDNTPIMGELNIV